MATFYVIKKDDKFRKLFEIDKHLDEANEIGERERVGKKAETIKGVGTKTT